MYEILTWSYRFVFVPLTVLYVLFSYMAYVKRKKGLEGFLPFIIVLISASVFAVIAFNLEPLDYTAAYIGGAFIISYLLARFILKKLLKPDNLILFDNINFLLAIGLGILYRLSPKYGSKQFIFIVAGYAVLFIVAALMKKIPVNEKSYKVIGPVILALLVLTQIFGTTINGSKNWIKISSFVYQPSELLKILFIFFIACLLHVELNLKRFAGIMLAVLTTVAFFALQKDLGSALIFFAVFLVMLAAKDEKLYYTGISAVTAVLGALVSYVAFSHIRSRVLAWADPWKYASDKSYQITQSLFAIASGGLLGTGLFSGNPNYIPAIHTDFIFSAICEEMGILSAISILLVFALTIIIGMDISLHSRNRIYSMVALGLTSVTAVQALVIVCGVLNIIPITGVTLPFVSYGGSSLISQFINIGLLYFIGGQEKSDTYER